MNTYYVSTTGNDAGPGTASAPWLTIDHALASIAAGDTIMVGNGSYAPAFNDQSRLWLQVTKPCTLRSITPLGAILDGQLRCHSVMNFTATSANDLIQDFVIQHGAHGGCWMNSLGAKGVTLRGLEIRNISNIPDASDKGNAGVYMDGAAIVAVDTCNLHDIGRTSLVDPGNAFDHAIYTHGNVTVTNSTFGNLLQGWAVQTSSGATLYFRNNLINGPVLYSGAGGVKNGQIMLWQANISVDISSNIFSNPRQFAIETFQYSGPCKTGNNSVTGGATLGGPPNQIPSGATGPQGPQSAQKVIVTVNGTAVNTTMPVTIQVQ